MDYKNIDTLIKIDLESEETKKAYKDYIERQEKEASFWYSIMPPDAPKDVIDLLTSKVDAQGNFVPEIEIEKDKKEE